MRMRGSLGITLLATASLLLSGCAGGGPSPSPGPSSSKGPLPNACRLVTAEQVAAVIGTAVTAATGSGTSCGFRPLSPGAVGNFDPRESPAPNGIITGVSLRISHDTAAAAARRLSPGSFFTPQAVEVPGADAAALVVGPHLDVLFVQRGSVTVEVEVFRGLGMDPYLARGIARVILANLAAGVAP